MTIQELQELHRQLLRGINRLVGEFRDSPDPEIRVLLEQTPRYTDADLNQIVTRALRNVSSMTPEEVRGIVADLIARKFDRQPVKLPGHDKPTDFVKWSD
jgi:hypothetical protein